MFSALSVKNVCFLLLFPAIAIAFSPFSATNTIGNREGFRAAYLSQTKPRFGATVAVWQTNDEQTGSDAPASSPSKIDNIIKDIHDQALPFRIVVIGEGAILETTSVLGPHMASSVSPKSGERLVTLASDDRSFEFHLKVDRVGKVTFSEKDKKLENGEKKTMRICRFLTQDGGPICSLILADKSQDAADWFRGLTIRYGYEVSL